jgi:para-aminobenzoate synthetase/4-amino-4-deoxychorismate lyase
MTATVDRPAFNRAFARIKRHIADGDTYQVNYTFRLDGDFAGDPRALFADLVDAQRPASGIYLRFGSIAICSASPELFFSRTGTLLTAKPMKGTARRGPNMAADLARRDRLLASPKERAENIMIVDMMRNDIGRVAEPGSVSVPALLSVERYPTLWQMTSTVTGTSRAPLADVFAALYPSASVTGAPKVRTMEILAELEQGPRGVYTGAIGRIAPGGDARFNVAIRTAVIDLERGRLSYGIGSGIVWDSDESAEYDECLLKAAILQPPRPAFELLETIRWTPADGFFLLSRHLDRLSDAASYFGYDYRPDAIREALDKGVSASLVALRVRLLVSPDGSARIETHPLAPAPPATIGFAAAPIDPEDPFLFHKTTNRMVYERAARAGLDDVILWNSAGHVTESTIANVVADLDGARVTPPIECGLLPGTFRAELLARGEVVERVVTREELRRARRIWLINSVQGWRPATLVAE